MSLNLNSESLNGIICLLRHCDIMALRYNIVWYGIAIWYGCTHLLKVEMAELIKEVFNRHDEDGSGRWFMFVGWVGWVG